MIALFPNCAFVSETTRMIEISRALEARGMPTAIASQGGPYARLLDEAGIRWTRLSPGMDAAGAAAFLDALLAMGPGGPPMYDDAFLRAAIASEVAFLEERGARLAVIGFNLVTYLSSRVAGLPLATSHGGAFLPPVMERGLCPAPVNPAMPGSSFLPAFVQRWMSNALPPRFGAPVAFLNRMARELGVEPVPSLAALMCGDLTLVTELPEILGIPAEEMEAWRPRSTRQYRKDTRLVYTGPLFARLDLPIPPRVEAFLNGPGPLVYVAPTSVKAPFLRELVRRVQAAEVRVLVASTIHEVQDLEDERTLVEPLLPNHLVMPRVDLVVIMGGQGSVSTAMASGTPLIGLPYHGEQELNVALAEREGVGLRMAPQRATTEALTAAVRAMLADPTFRENAARVQRLYASCDGAGAAADAILRFLDSRRAAA